MGQFKDIFLRIDGVEIYPIISLLLFFIVFVTMLTYVMRMKKEKIESLSSLPLDNENSHEI